MVLATPGLLLALAPAWRDVLPRLPRLLGAALASVALPYAWMVWLSHQSPLISFDQLLRFHRHLEQLLVLRQPAGLQRGRRSAPARDGSDRWSFLGWLARDLVRQSTLPCSIACRPRRRHGP